MLKQCDLEARDLMRNERFKINLSFYLDNWIHNDAINLEHKGKLEKGDKFWWEILHLRCLQNIQ